MEIQPCKQCENLVQRYPSEFKSGRGKFCSRKCGKLYRWLLRQVWKQCPQCGKDFSFDKCRLAARPQKYCSIECANNALKKRITIICAMCGKEREIPLCRKKSGVQFCLCFCSSQWLKIQHIKKSFTTRYTPEFLRALAKPNDFCNFPDCEKLRWFSSRPKTIFVLCKYHTKLVNGALCDKRKKRKLILKKEGLL